MNRSGRRLRAGLGDSELPRTGSTTVLRGRSPWAALRGPLWASALWACLTAGANATAAAGDDLPPWLTPVPASRILSPQPGDSAGRKLALSYCQMCHLFPEPDLLTKAAWKKNVLPRMRSFLGLTKVDYASYADGELMKTLGVYPDPPLMLEKDWQVVETYYLETAPETPLPPPPHAEIELGLKLFQTEFPEFRLPSPSTTLVQISPTTHRIYVGDDQRKSLYLLNAAGQLVRTLRIDNAAVSLTESDQGLYVTSIGHTQPSQFLDGDVRYVEGIDTPNPVTKFIVKGLPRTTCSEFADLNADGRTDIAVCMFGDLTGRFAWFENQGSDRYQEHLLYKKPGPIWCVAHDYNRDGYLDLAVLMTQHLEEMLFYLNDGKGNFSPRLIFKQPPVWGHNHFELADFNRDGLMDLVVTAGDNAEYNEITMKRYHGIRIYLNRGNFRFEEAFCYPLNGVVKAMARDFDHDGDLDLAAISWFPDYRKTPRESFVYLENQGGLTFTASTFAKCIIGRWLVMDVGDLEGDGDLDMVLGSYIQGPTPVPQFLMDAWQENKLPVVILRNTLR